MSEDEIKVLMAKEIVEDACEATKDKAKCRAILHRILTTGEGLGELTGLDEDDRKKLKERFRELGVE